MRTVADVSTDDLVNSLLNSVTSGSSSTSTSTSTSSASTESSSSSSSPSSSASESQSQGSDSSATEAPATTSPAKVTSSPATSGSSASASATSAAAAASTPETTSGGTGSGDDDSSSGGGAALSIGIAIGVLALVVATLLFLRARRRRQRKERESDLSPPAGATCLTVPADRGFKKEQELGMPEMSIELAPGDLGMSKGFDASFASSARSSAASNPYTSSFASSTDSSVFNTQGGVSPTFSNRKMASYSYQYRASEEPGDGNAGNPSMSSARSTGSKTFHLSGMIGNGTASGRGAASRAPGARKLSAPDEYAELVTTTNAHGEMHMEEHNRSPQADFTQSAASHKSMGPDADNHSFLAPLPSRKAPTPAPDLSRQAPAIRASDESMGPDSPVAGREKRTGSVYDTLPKLSGEKMSASSRSSEEDPNAMSTASFLTESSIASTSPRESSVRGSGFVTFTPLLQQLSSAEDSDYGEDLSSERSSSASTDSSNPRAGSLIAMNLEAKDGCSEIAI